MKLMRNPDIRRMFVFFTLAVFCCGCLLSFLHPPAIPAGVFFLLIVEAYCLWESASRYREIRQLSEGMEELLFGRRRLDISRFREGDISIMANTAGKLAVRLESERDAIQKDKVFLEKAIADIAHQLRTPLTAMSLREEELLGLITEEQACKLLREIIGQQRRLEWLTEGMLKLAKLDSGTIRMDRKPVPLTDLLQEAAAPFAALMELKNQKLVMKAEDETICVDREWMREAISNVVKNCVEHMEEGTLTLTSRLTPNYILITVRDTGKGLAQKDIPHLFERFYRGEDASPTGVGIGLSLSREIVKAHGGRIEALNADGGGAEFRLWLYR